MADTFVVERSQKMAASPSEVYAEISDLARWEAWSPWAAMDPNMTTTYSGDPGTVGAGSHWVGNRKVGEGSMTVTSLDAPEKVNIDLSFVKPFKADNKVTFTIAPDGDGSNVTWSMTGALNFMTKLMGRFGKTMDKMVGPDFEKGLASLKGVVEA